MRRWHEDYPRTLREWKKHYLDHVEGNVDWGRGNGRDPYEIDCVCDVQKGRFRKRHPFDCGNARCHICHGDKYPRRKKTRHEMLAGMNFREWLADGVHGQQCAAVTPRSYGRFALSPQQAATTGRGFIIGWRATELWR